MHQALNTIIRLFHEKRGTNLSFVIKPPLKQIPCCLNTSRSRMYDAHHVLSVHVPAHDFARGSEGAVATVCLLGDWPG